MTYRYILKDSVPVPEPDLLTRAKWMEGDDNRRVALTEIGEVHVSTVFLGLDSHRLTRQQIHPALEARTEAQGIRQSSGQHSRRALGANEMEER